MRESGVVEEATGKLQRCTPRGAEYEAASGRRGGVGRSESCWRWLECCELGACLRTRTMRAPRSYAEREMATTEWRGSMPLRAEAAGVLLRHGRLVTATRSREAQRELLTLSRACCALGTCLRTWTMRAPHACEPRAEAFAQVTVRLPFRESDPTALILECRRVGVKCTMRWLIVKVILSEMDEGDLAPR